MESHPNLTKRYALIQALYWMNYCVLGGFANVYLLHHGFSNTACGIVVAASGIFSAFISPFIASYADLLRSMSVRAILVRMAGGMVLLSVLILLTGKYFLLTAIAYTAGMTLIQLMASFTNSLATQSIRSGWPVNFGIARGAGSAGYGILAHLLSFFVARFQPDILPWAALLLWCVTLAALLRFPNTKDAAAMARYALENDPNQDARAKGTSRVEKAPTFAGFFRRYPRYGVFLIGLFLVYISHALSNVFVTQIVMSKGGSDADTGLILGIQALVEIPVMLGFSFMMKKVRIHNWLRICAVFYFLKIIGTMTVPTVTGLAFVQLLEMGSYAVMVIAGLYYVNSIMDVHDAVKGQAFMGISTTIANVTASWLGGIALDHLGVHRTLFLGMLVCAVGTIIMFVGTRQVKNS